jgi:preprotein translocase subunit SecF
MEFFKAKTNINFLGLRKWSWMFSFVLIMISCVSMGVRGMNWGLDFTGGYSIQVHFQTAPKISAVREALESVGFTREDVVTFGSTKDLMLSFSPKDLQASGTSVDNAQLQQVITDKITAALPNASITSVNYTGSEVGSEMAQTGVLAMLVAILAIMLYITLRFEIKFAVSAALALAHDPIIILGVFSLFQIRFDLTALAAVLAVIGYSLNDTIVVYDRIRENFRLLRAMPVVEVVNQAINDTLSRTVMTSGLTFIVVFVLFLLGGPSIHGFALALMIGVVVGTYSSIYIAGALAVLLGLNREAFIPKPKDVDGLP